MSDNDSLAIFSRGAQLLAEANTIQKAKELKDLALTASDWAKRKGMGEEAIQYGRNYALDAERKMGEMLLDTPRNKGAQRMGPAVVRDDSRPTLPSLGITRDEASKAQNLFKVPQEDFEDLKNGKKTRAQLRRKVKEENNRKFLERAASWFTEERKQGISRVCDVRHCSCAELFADGIYPDAVITDPPYPKEFLDVFTELAKAAKDIPLVAVMVGQSYLPDVIRRLCEHLRYRWTIAYLTPGGQAVQQWQAKTNCSWKPVLLFGQSNEWFGDVAKSNPNDNDKEHHDWGQSESGMADLVCRLTKPGQIVCDPFVGGGTTAVACLSNARRFIGCDLDKKAVDETLLRVKALK